MNSDNTSNTQKFQLYSLHTSLATLINTPQWADGTPVHAVSFQLVPSATF